MAAAGAKKAKRRPDLGSFGGLALAMAGILAGLLLEGGKMRDVESVTAALIVLGGTLGAIMINTPVGVLLGAVRRLGAVFFEEGPREIDVVEEIVGYASKARKMGLVSLEQDAAQIEDAFLRKALNLAVDGTDTRELRDIMQLQMDLEEQRGQAEAKVFESAGGYAPTIGIIGAVMGLMQVMKNLANIDEVGRGIATAFIATVYGVALANILLLPAANKIKARVRRQCELQELMLEGVAALCEGLNPKLLRGKLDAFLVQEAGVTATAASAGAPSGATVAAAGD